MLKLAGNTAGNGSLSYSKRIAIPIKKEKSITRRCYRERSSLTAVSCYLFIRSVMPPYKSLHGGIMC